MTRAEQAGVTTAAPTFTVLLGSALLEGRMKDTAVMLTLTLTVMITVMLTLTLTLAVR